MEQAAVPAVPAVGVISFESARDDEIRRRLDALVQAARRLPAGSDEETQDELGQILQLLPAVERTKDLALLNNLELAVESLLSTPPNRLLAIRLREASQQTVARRSFLRAIMPGTSASTWVVAGMATLVFVAIPVNLALIWLLNGWIVTGGEVGEPISTRRVAYAFVVLLGLAGALGSIISILVRIKDFTEIRILNPPALFWTGFFKPIIGAAFSLFVFCAFAAGLINVTSGVNQRFMFLTLGFIAGFSERFAPDLVSGIERTISIGSGPPPAEPPKPSGSGNS